MIRAVILFAAWTVAFLANASYGEQPIGNYTTWTDAASRLISCHDGGISRFGNTFYWYGTSYKGNPAGL